MRIAVLGGGNMGEAIVRSVLKRKLSTSRDITVSDMLSTRREVLSKKYGVEVTDNNGLAVKKKDVDWGEFLMDKPMRAFDPVLYSGWYGYREFSDEPVPGLGSHFIDLVHYITGTRFPTRTAAHSRTR